MKTRDILLVLLLGSMGLESNAQSDDSSSSDIIRVSPSRIVLGALDYGQSRPSVIPLRLTISGLSPNIRVTNIDCSHAKGVKIIGQQNVGSVSIVDLVANSGEFTEKQPFGAFVRNSIRIETNSSVQPQFVVPVTAWLAVNQTPRDFSQYVFGNAVRWQGPWPTPNIAGAVLTIIAILLIGTAGWANTITLRIGFWGAWIVKIIALTGAIVIGCLVCLTYSRGAWLALLMGCGGVAAFSPTCRRIGLGFGIGFLILVCCVPSGLKRCQSYANVESDLSIVNRMKLWEGAFQAMAEHPFTGVGEGQFETSFESDFQGYEHTAKTATAVNDYLTFGAERGLLEVSLLMGPLLACLVSLITHAVRNGHPGISTVAAASVAALTASTFSTLWGAWDYRCLTGFIMAALIAGTLIAYVRTFGVGQACFHLLAQSSKGILFVFIVLSCLSAGSLLLLPTRITSVELVTNEREFKEVEPRWSTPRGVIIYFTDQGSLPILYHSTLRPLASMGWKVFPVPTATEQTIIHSIIEAIHRQSPQLQIFTAGDAIGGKMAWKLATENPNGVIKAGGGVNFLSMDMVASDPAKAPGKPFLIFQSLYGDGDSANPTLRARDRFAFRDAPLTVLLCDEDTSRFSSGWTRYLLSLSKFFQNECTFP